MLHHPFCILVGVFLWVRVSSYATELDKARQMTDNKSSSSSNNIEASCVSERGDEGDEE